MSVNVQWWVAGTDYMYPINVTIKTGTPRGECCVTEMTEMAWMGDSVSQEREGTSLGKCGEGPGPEVVV